jgi:Zn-dependent protease
MLSRLLVRPARRLRALRRPRPSDLRPLARRLGSLWVVWSATLVFAVAFAGLVAARERNTGRLWLLGRFVVADAVVITVFNLLPVPPLDGGRAVIAAVAAWQGELLSADLVFWVQVTGLVAAVPMVVWTQWTRRIDSDRR